MRHLLIMLALSLLKSWEWTEYIPCMLRMSYKQYLTTMHIVFLVFMNLFNHSIVTSCMSYRCLCAGCLIVSIWWTIKLLHRSSSSSSFLTFASFVVLMTSVLVQGDTEKDILMSGILIEPCLQLTRIEPPLMNTSARVRPEYITWCTRSWAIYSRVGDQ